MKTTRFTFDNRFDAPPVIEDDVVPDAPPPMFSEDEITAARQAAYQDGVEAGRQEAETGFIEQTARAAEAIAAAADSLLEERQERLSAMQVDAVAIAHSIARTLAPALTARDPLAEVEGMIRECLGFCYTEPRLVVRVNEDLVDPLKDVVDRITMEASFAGKVILLGDDRLEGDHCRVEWADGGAERNLAALQDRVDRLVQRHLDNLTQTMNRTTSP